MSIIGIYPWCTIQPVDLCRVIHYNPGFACGALFSWTYCVQRSPTRCSPELQDSVAIVLSYCSSPMYKFISFHCTNKGIPSNDFTVKPALTEAVWCRAWKRQTIGLGLGQGARREWKSQSDQ